MMYLEVQNVLLNRVLVMYFTLKLEVAQFWGIVSLCSVDVLIKIQFLWIFYLHIWVLGQESKERE